MVDKRIKEIREKFNKIRENKSRDITLKKLEIKKIIEEAKNLLNELSSIENGEGIDYVTCRICGLKGKSIGVHISRKHNLTAKEYKKIYPGAEVISLQTRQKNTEGCLNYYRG